MGFEVGVGVGLLVGDDAGFFVGASSVATSSPYRTKWYKTWETLIK